MKCSDCKRFTTQECDLNPWKQDHELAENCGYFVHKESEDVPSSQPLQTPQVAPQLRELSYCPICGAKLLGPTDFCTSCGEDLMAYRGSSFQDDTGSKESQIDSLRDRNITRRIATTSYTTKAVLTLVLWFFAIIPGLVANMVFWNEAKKEMKLTGVRPAGYDFLEMMLTIGIAISVIAVIALIASIPTLLGD